MCGPTQLDMMAGARGTQLKSQNISAQLKLKMGWSRQILNKMAIQERMYKPTQSWENSCWQDQLVTGMLVLDIRGCRLTPKRPLAAHEMGSLTDSDFTCLFCRCCLSFSLLSLYICLFCSMVVSFMRTIHYNYLLTLFGLPLFPINLPSPYGCC